MFMYHGFIKSIPVELEEAATIDGCRRAEIFYKIIFPILTPIHATVLVLNGIWIWNDYLLPLLVLGKGNAIQTIPLAVSNFAGAFVKQWDLILTAILLAMIPGDHLFPAGAEIHSQGHGRRIDKMMDRLWASSKAQCRERWAEPLGWLELPDWAEFSSRLDAEFRASRSCCGSCIATGLILRCRRAFSRNAFDGLPPQAGGPAGARPHPPLNRTGSVPATR
jgi:hypothetical protein